MKRNTQTKTKRVSLSLVAACMLAAAQGATAMTTTVTDAIGTQEAWTYSENLGVNNLTSRINQTDNKGIVQTFDANNNLLSRTDEEGRTTTYTYNATNQRVSMTEASGTPEARTTTYTYVSPDINLVTTETSPSVHTGSNRVVTRVYDNDLNITQISIDGFTPSGSPVSRTSNISYNVHGQITQIDGPRIGINDSVVFNYYSCTNGAECGQLQSITDEIGHTTNYDTYDANARLTRMTDALGGVTTYGYHPRGWLLAVTRTSAQGNSRTTSFQYDHEGQVTQVSTPDNIVLTFSYDAAHDLRSVADNLGNRIEYIYDAKGNTIQSDIFDPDNTLVRELSRQYDIRNYVTSINEAGSLTQMVNDAVGNTTTETDPNLNPNTQYSFDALDRLTSTLDALTNTTTYQYDVTDQLTQVTAPNGSITSYQYDDLGNKLSETSADRGTLMYSHDDAGNVISETDARGITATLSYDELGRILQIAFPDTDENISYLYDSCINGTGRLCKIVDESGITDYRYDYWGNITQTVKRELDDAGEVIGTYTTQYTYDAADRVITQTNPNGWTVSYSRDAIGRVNGVTIADENGTTKTLLSGRDYRADDMWTGQVLGDTLNPTTYTKSYDTQGRLTQHTVGSYNRTYQYDANGNILQYQGSLDRDYTYDVLDRLTEELGAELGVNFDTMHGFSYDANGNRLNEAMTPDGGSTQNIGYQYTVNTNRINQIAGNSYTLDASGRVTIDELGRTYHYNDAGRLIRVELASSILGEYLYNAHQQRTRKTVNNVMTLFHYDIAGNLISESDTQGNITRTYVYADGERIAMLGQGLVQTQTTQAAATDPSLSLDNGALASTSPANPEVFKKILPIIFWYLTDESTGTVNPPVQDPLASAELVFYVNDHLGTPQRLLDENAQLVWEAEYQAFGKASVITSIVDQNHRFPGQYYDSETGLHYNWHRYYQPNIGRYITSDPIGMLAGPNSFGYVASNPLTYIDLTGLYRRVSIGVSGTVLAGFPGAGFIGLGGGGGTSFGISVPNDWTNLRCYQLYVQFQANIAAGWGAFVGVGFIGSLQDSSSTIRSMETTTGIIVEGNAGVGVSGGASFTADGNILEPSDWLNPVTGMSSTIVPRLGGGLGLGASVGQFTATTLATPTIGDDCECNKNF